MSIDYYLLYNCKYFSSIYTLIIVSIYISKITTNIKSLYYEDKEMQDIMKESYQIKRNHIIYHDFVISISRRL